MPQKCGTIYLSSNRKVKNMSYFSVDRFEEDYAVLVDENGNSLPVERSLLPFEAKEGSVLKLDDGEYFLDRKEESARRKRIVSLQNKLFKE